MNRIFWSAANEVAVYTESSLVVTGYRTCEERETTLHMEGRCFVAAAVHARRVVALYSYAAISRAIGRTRGQNNEPTIVQFRRAFPERYFPADAKSMYSQRGLAREDAQI